MGSAGWGLGNRGQSAPLGLALVFAVMIVSTTAVVALGADAITTTQTQLDVERTEKSLTELNSKTALVALGQTDVQQVSLPASSSSTYQIDEDAGWMNVSYQNTTSGSRTTVFNESMGEVAYHGSDETRLAYQGGGVWRTNGDGTSVMVSPPEFHYRDATLTLPLVTVSGSGAIRDSASISHNASKQYWPNKSAGAVNPLESGKVEVRVQSEYYRAWGQYFETRTDGSVNYNHSSNIVTLELLVPATNPPVQGGIVAGTPGTSMTIKNNAEADSYNSSVGPYSGFPDNSNSRIISAGDVDVENNAIIEGDLESGGDVQISNNGEIRGNLSYGGTASGGGYPGGVGGWSAQNASVTAPDSVERLIDTRRSSISSSNDNADSSVDIDNSSNTLENCASTCELTAGDYYLSEITLNNGENARIDTSGGDVNIVVNGTITIQNNQQIAVVGGNRVNIYVEGDYYQRNGALVTVEDDKAPNFWVYTNPDADVEFNNNAEFTGVIYGPNGPDNDGADITLDQNAHVYGSVVGDVTFVSNNYGIHYDEALQRTETTTIPQAIPSVTYVHISTNDVNITSG
ncbi:DUF7289 family protein [Haloarcula marismortui]|nr:hypothetical protein [Haloarcula sinaiiensis]